MGRLPHLPARWHTQVILIGLIGYLEASTPDSNQQGIQKVT